MLTHRNEFGPPSSSALGRRPLTAAPGVRIPSGVQTGSRADTKAPNFAPKWVLLRLFGRILEPAGQRIGRRQQVGGPAGARPAPHPVNRPGHRDGGDHRTAAVAHGRRDARHTWFTLGGALCPATLANFG